MTFTRTIYTEADMALALADRRREKGQLQEEVEHLVGLTHGHLGKIEAGGKAWGKKPFRIRNAQADGESQQSPASMTATLFWLLEHYGLRLVLMDEATAETLESNVGISATTHTERDSRREMPLMQSMIVAVRRRS
jgi:transcriptional regulator with XRE-family HTH domain